MFESCPLTRNIVECNRCNDISFFVEERNCELPVAQPTHLIKILMKLGTVESNPTSDARMGSPSPCRRNSKNDPVLTATRLIHPRCR